jgi:hypothetical protein
MSKIWADMQPIARKHVDLSRSHMRAYVINTVRARENLSDTGKEKGQLPLHVCDDYSLIQYGMDKLLYTYLTASTIAGFA